MNTLMKASDNSSEKELEVVAGCPKFLKNGPCGGYREGRCEVYPDKKCIFVAAWEKNPDSLRREL